MKQPKEKSYHKVPDPFIYVKHSDPRQNAIVRLVRMPFFAQVQSMIILYQRSSAFFILLRISVFFVYFKNSYLNKLS